MTTTAPSKLNPYRDPGLFGFVIVGNYILPGVVKAIDGAEKPEEWAFQKSTSGNNATSVWKGSKLAESIKITLDALDEDEFDGLYVLRDMLRPKPGAKPPSFSVINGIINFNGITRVSTVLIGQPKPAAQNSWTIDVTLCEFNPSAPAKTGPADPAKPNQPESENDKAAKELDAVIQKAASL